MNKDAVQDLMTGAVVVVLAYAMYRHFVKAPGASASKLVPQAMMPRPQAVNVPVASPYTTIYDYMAGGLVDYGAFDGRNYLAELETGGQRPPRNGPINPDAPLWATWGNA